MKKQLLFGLLLAGGSISTALAQTSAYVQWTLKKSATDSTAVRSANVTPVAALFKRYVLSSGQPIVISSSLTMAYPAYTGAYGQAFGWNASGGGWSSSATPAGPGSTVRRGAAYEEFSFTANGAVQVDSLIFTISAANSANGYLALTYSKSGFATDSAEFTGGKGPTGVLPATANGTFTAVGSTTQTNAAAANRIQFPQYDATLADRTRTYRMAFNGATGIALTSGNKLSARLHVAVSSSSDGRYVLLKNVIIKSKQAVVLATRSTVSTDLNVYPNPAQSRLTVPHAAAGAGAQLSLYSATGARVLAQPVAAGSLETAVSLESLASGLYLVEYNDGGQRYTTRVVKD